MVIFILRYRQQVPLLTHQYQVPIPVKVYTCEWACTLAQARTHALTSEHARSQGLTHKEYTSTCTWEHARAHMSTNTHTNMSTHTHEHEHTHTSTNTHTRARTHTNMNTRTHIQLLWTHHVIFSLCMQVSVLVKYSPHLKHSVNIYFCLQETFSLSSKVKSMNI